MVINNIMVMLLSQKTIHKLRHLDLVSKMDLTE